MCVRLHDDDLTISNPAGLVEGVTLANLLTTEPRPRNPTLADAMKRILCRLTAAQSRDLLKRLRDAGHLVQHGERRGSYYTPGDDAGEK